MAKLFQVVAVKNNNINYNPACTIYLNTKNVVWAGSVIYYDNTGASATGTQIIIAGYDGTFTQEIISSDSLATIKTRMNAAFTTDVHTLTLTAIDPFAGATPTATQQSQLPVNVDDIWMVMTHPLYTDGSLIQVQNATKSCIESYRVANVAATIASDSNA